MIRCSYKQCRKKASKEVIVTFRADNTNRALKSAPLMHCCGDHSKVSWEDIYSDNWWMEVCLSFIRSGKMIPDKEHSYLEVRDMKETKIRKA